MGFLKKLFKKNGNKADALYDDRTPETKATGKPVEAPAAKAPQKTENAAPAAKAPQKTESAAPAKPKKIEAEKSEKIEAEKSEKIEETEPEKGGKSEKSARSPFFEIKRAKDDRYVFNLYAANHVIVATSQVYSSSSAAQNGIKSVIANADAPIEDQTLRNYETLTYPKWEIYRDKGDEFRFRLNASNGSTICHSQGYTSKDSCKNGIESIRKNAEKARVEKAYLQKQEK